MSSFPGSPRLIKGAIVGIDPFNPVASVVVFQYNPDTVTRTVSAQASGDNPDHGEALRLKGPPQETIKLEVEIDATDQLEKVAITDDDQLSTGEFLATKMGLYPALAALEMLLYPKSTLMVANEVLARFGIIEVIPPEAPLTLLIWGRYRALPVRLTQLSITEEAFDRNLNPIRAKVSLDLRVLSYQELGLLSVGGALFMAQQVVKEAIATIGNVGDIQFSRIRRGFSELSGI
jgi:hypothetical protein